MWSNPSRCRLIKGLGPSTYVYESVAVMPKTSGKKQKTPHFSHRRTCTFVPRMELIWPGLRPSVSFSTTELRLGSQEGFCRRWLFSCAGPQQESATTRETFFTYEYWEGKHFCLLFLWSNFSCLPAGAAITLDMKTEKWPCPPNLNPT